MNSPIQWLGGKGLFVNTLLRHMPDHTIYVEPFGGAAALFFAKRPSDVEVYNDIDSRLVNLFRVLQDKGLRHDLMDMLAHTLVSREIKYECWEKRGVDEGMVKNAWKFYVIIRQGFGGKYEGSWGHKLTKRTDWVGAVHALPELCRRLDNVQIEHDSWKDILTRYDTEDTFFYLDPPYVKGSRRGGEYVHEMDDDEHIDLIEKIQSLKGKVLLSGYNNDIYWHLPWHKTEHEVICNVVGKTRTSGLKGEGGLKNQTRTECLWRNYPVSGQLELC